MPKFLEKPIKGALLIAEPLLEDANFERSVILIAEHNADGTVGFIMNKKLELTLGDILEELHGITSPVYEGGPVQRDEMYILHQCGEKIRGSIHIADNLWWGGELTEIKSKIESGELAPNKFKFFLGYSGWTKGQLIHETNERSWIMLKSDFNKLFESKESDLWKGFMIELGGEYPLWSNSPSNPILN